MLHLIYCCTKQEAKEEFDDTVKGITDRGFSGELFDLDNICQGKIVECLGIVDAGFGKTFPISHEMTKKGCRWAILVRTK